MEPLAEELINNCEKKDMKFSAGEAITETFMNDAGDFGIVTEGMLFLESMDENGVRRILDYYTEGDIFRKSDFAVGRNTDHYIYAKTRCKVSFFYEGDMTDFINRKEMAAHLKSYLETGLKRRLSHIHILAQRTMRQKIAVFLENESLRANRNPFELKMSFTDCADYIAADRSAMMREIKNMEKDGLIIKNKKRITLRYI